MRDSQPPVDPFRPRHPIPSSWDSPGSARPTRLAVAVLVLFVILPGITLVACSGGSGHDDVEEPPSTTPPPPAAAQQFPCFAASGSAGGTPAGAQPATSYVLQIVGIAAQIGGVSPPTGGVWAVPNESNASYHPNADRIQYSPSFLTGLLQATGLFEAPDSVLFHEVGHMWVFKIGRAQCLGFGTPDANWRHEYQADSFAGAVLAVLGGNPSGSLQVYQQVFAGWGATHPPGQNRASVFLDGYLQQTPQNFCTALLSVSPTEDNAVETQVARLHLLREALRSLDLDPYDAASDTACELAAARLGLPNVRRDAPDGRRPRQD